jgi:hypothetical protein
MATVTVTIGSGSDYATYAALVADAASAFSASDDAVIELNEDAVFNEQFDLGDIRSAVAVSSIHLTSNSSFRHDGQEGTGARIGKSGNGASITDSVVRFATGCDCRISWLEVYSTGKWNYMIDIPDNSGFTRTYEVDHCIIHNNGAPSSGNCYAIRAQKCDVLRIDNNIVYDISNSATGGAGSYGIVTSSGGTPEVYLRNNTVDDITSPAGSGTVIGIDYNAGTTLSECLNNVVGSVSGNSTVKCWDTATHGTRSNNASTDATAPGTSAQTSVSVGTLFADQSARDFRIQDTDSALYENGTTATGGNDVADDVGGNTRAGTWSIGAFGVTAVVADAISITSPVTRKVHQRTSGAATVTITGTYTNSPTSIEYRWKGGSWATLDASPSAGTFSVAVSLSEGQGDLEVRFSNDTDVNDSVSLVSVGDVFHAIGQSNMAGRLTNAQTYSHATLEASEFDSSSWSDLTDPTGDQTGSGSGSCLPLLATLIMEDQGVPVGFINTAAGGTKLVDAEWDKAAGGSKYNPAITEINAASLNGLAAWLWDQGEGDANTDPQTSEADYNSHLDDLITNLQTDASFSSPLICALTGQSNADSAAGSSLDNVRKAQIGAWGDNADIEVGPNSIKRTNLHWETDNEGAQQAALWWFAIEDALYGGSNGRGPRPSSIYKSGSTCVIVFDRDLNTSDTSYTSTAFTVDNDDGTARTVSSVARDGSRKVVLTLSGPLDGSNPTVTFASINTAAGATIPRSTAISLPATINSISSMSISAEPIYAQAVGDEPESGNVNPNLGVGIGLGI